VFEGPETFSLTARNAAGVAASGTATIRDEGQGEVRLPDGGVDLGAIKDDDRPLSVSSMTVNEASPFAFFTVAGQAGQTATLQLANGSAGAQDFGPSLEILVGDQWIQYSGQAVTLDATGRLSVRTALVNDGVFEGAEDFRLIAQNAVGVAASGVATILDDGQGEIRSVDGALDLVTVKNDDRVLDVSSSTVNEASPFAFFTVTGPAGQVLTLQLNPGSASEQDYGPVVEVFNGVNWESYSGQLLQLDPNGRLQVRTTLTHDQVFEGAERFSLSAIKTNGQSAQGTMTILDDGTGDVYRPDGRLNSLVAKDDDRRSPPPVAPPPVELPQPVWIPLSPERWMPHAGEYELHHRWDQERDQETSAHTPLRFDSALQPRLNLDSAKDLGLTEPVVTDASQRLTTYDWLQVLPPNSSSSVVADDVILALQPKLLPGLSKPQVGSASKWVFDMPRDVLFDASKQGSVTLRASLANGQALPDWLAFNADLGRFEVVENERLIKEVLVDVHVQSIDGSMTRKAYQLDMTALSESVPAPLPARQGLTEKLKLAAKGNAYVQLPVETVSQ
jgi:hypothetical protein